MGNPQQVAPQLKQGRSGQDAAASEMTGLQPFTHLLQTQYPRGSDWLNFGHVPIGHAGEGKGGSSSWVPMS